MKKWNYAGISRPWTNGFRLFALFLLVFIAVNLYLGQQRVLQMPPQGIHLWRQADGLTFAYNYYKDGIDIFQPRLNNLMSNGGYSACEFPIIYAFVALLYKIFGPHTLIFRFVNLLIVFLGFYALFRMLSLLIGDMIQALAFSLIFFASSILIYYSSSFIPDPQALGFTLLGWWFFFRYLDKPAKKELILSFLFFTLGALIKVTFGINALAAIGIFAVERIWGIRLKSDNFTFKHPFTFVLLALLSLGSVLAWNSWMLHYNLRNGSSYFLTQARPIWFLNSAEIANNWKLITEYWYTKYYYESIFHFFLITMLSGLYWMLKAGRTLVFLSVFMVLGGLSYFLLFFQQFGQHDYYAINLMTTLMFPVVTAFVALRLKFPKIAGSWLISCLLLILAFLGIQYARLNLQRRYDPIVSVESGFNTGFYEMQSVLKKAGVSANAKIISMPDPSPNISLYFLDRQGWTIPAGAEKIPDSLCYLIRHGADYLVISDSNLSMRQDLQSFLTEKLAVYHGISLYKLNPAMNTKHCVFLRSKSLTWATRSK